MDDHTALAVEGLVKDYRIYPDPRHRIEEMLLRRQRHTKYRALDSVTFKLRRGEVVGILGRNGAGKSTLLKVLTGVLAADAGTVHLEGRISSILELGVGINPEYSGRENARLGALARGVPPVDLARKISEIIEFSELEAVIDNPLKTYSSGMQARLFFATAMAADAEVMIIDEALAAGDILFQEKCFQKIRALAASNKTILFVSHSMDLVQQLCNRAMLMHNGSIILDGGTAEVTKAYLDLSAHLRNLSMTRKSPEVSAIEARNIIGLTSQAAPAIEKLTSDRLNDSTKALDPTHVPSQACQNDIAPLPPKEAPSGHEKKPINIIDIDVINNEGDEVFAVEYGSRFGVRARFVSGQDFPSIIVGLEIRLPTGFLVYSIQNTLEDIHISCKKDRPFEVVWWIDNFLQNGYYFYGVGIGEVTDVSLGLRQGPFTIIDQKLNAGTITTIGAPEFGGVIHLRALTKVQET